MKSPMDLALDQIEWSELAERPADLKPSERYAVRTGVLRIGDIELDCAVLDDGTRVFTEVSLMRALLMRTDYSDIARSIVTGTRGETT